LLLAGASAVMMALIVFVIVDSVKVWFKIDKSGKNIEEAA